MIVVSGEALMDLFAGSDTPGGMTLDARVGGSPLNVAVGLARLGRPVAFFGAVSKDLLGERLLEALRDEGVGVDAVTRPDAPTTLAIVGLDTQGVPSYAFYGQGAADRMLPTSALERLGPAQAFHFGSFSMVVEPVAGTLRSLVKREHPRSVIAYDPNVRLHVEPSLERWRAALAWMQPRTHLLKISDEDLRLLFPGADASTLAADWLRAGAALVVVTHGAQGASAWTAAHHVEVRPEPVTVVDTVGAGDSFQAALLAALAERGLLTVAGLQSLPPAALHDILLFATRAAGVTCSRRGAELPRRGEIDER